MNCRTSFQKNGSDVDCTTLDIGQSRTQVTVKVTAKYTNTGGGVSTETKSKSVALTQNGVVSAYSVGPFTGPVLEVIGIEYDDGSGGGAKDPFAEIRGKLGAILKAIQERKFPARSGGSTRKKATKKKSVTKRPTKKKASR